MVNITGGLSFFITLEVVVDRSGCDRGSGELDNGSGHRCSQTYPSDRRSLGEHPYLSSTRAQIYTLISCLNRLCHILGL